MFFNSLYIIDPQGARPEGRSPAGRDAGRKVGTVQYDTPAEHPPKTTRASRRGQPHLPAPVGRSDDRMRDEMFNRPGHRACPFPAMLISHRNARFVSISHTATE